jgi:DNA segregation ATPase FtsK/SpoIIIE-like protein
VKFSRRVVTLDALYFQIDTGYKSLSGKWFDNMPDGVYVADHLLAEKTLTELSITCRHQVTGIYDKTGNSGAWVIVHRLESIDGLMNYVHFDDVMLRYPWQDKKRMPIPLGVSHNRAVQWETLKERPHWLIAGYTGSGKSNLVNVGICSLIATQSPDDLRLILIDLKGGMEFDVYRDIPHLHGGIVSEVDAVETMLADIVAVLYERMNKIRGTAKDIDVYRQRRPGEYMPRILLVFDELASIGDHGQTTKRILQYLTLIGRLGRALGIHSWLCTQRPDTNVLTGAVKANMNLRITGRMSTASDSITVLGNGSAAALAAVDGRMVYMRGPDPMFIQTPHITEDAVFESIEKARNHPTPPAIPIPEHKIVDVVWTPEKVIELSLEHLGGKITWKAIYEAADDLSQSQARELVKSIWSMKDIEFQGKKYRVVVGRSNTRFLEEISSTDG